MMRKQMLNKNQKEGYATIMPLSDAVSSYEAKNGKKLSTINLLSSLEFCDHSKNWDGCAYTISSLPDQYP